MRYPYVVLNGQTWNDEAAPGKVWPLVALYTLVNLQAAITLLHCHGSRYARARARAKGRRRVAMTDDKTQKLSLFVTRDIKVVIKADRTTGHSHGRRIKSRGPRAGVAHTRVKSATEGRIIDARYHEKT